MPTEWFSDSLCNERIDFSGEVAKRSIDVGEDHLTEPEKLVAWFGFDGLCVVSRKVVEMSIEIGQKVPGCRAFSGSSNQALNCRRCNEQTSCERTMFT